MQVTRQAAKKRHVSIRQLSLSTIYFQKDKKIFLSLASTEGRRRKLLILSDSLILVNSLSEIIEPPWEIRNICINIKGLLSPFDLCKFERISRNCNGEAHQLSQMGMHSEVDDLCFVWMSHRHSYMTCKYLLII